MAEPQKRKSCTDAAFAFGQTNQLLYFSYDGIDLFLDGLAGKVMFDLPHDLKSTLEDLRASRPSENAGWVPEPVGGWNRQLAEWAQEAEAWPATDDLRGLAGTTYRTPQIVTLFSAAACNLACGYCYASEGSFGGKSNIMSLDTARTTVGFLKNMWRDDPRPHVQVTMLGGEPLLNKPVIEYLSEEIMSMNDAGNYPRVHLVIDTNGTLWKETRLTEILKPYKDLVTVEISIDGNRERHDEQRVDHKGRGSFDAALEAFFHVRDAGFHVAANGTAQPPYPMVDIASDFLALGIERFYVRLLEPHKFGTSINLVRPFDSWERAYRKYAEWTLEQKKAGREFHSDLDGQADKLATRLEHHGNRAPSAAGCTAGTSMLGVSTAGQIQPCDRFFGLSHHVLGTVTDGLSQEKLDAWHDELRTVGILSRTHPQCSVCYARWSCKGGCYARNFSKYGKIDEIDPSYCRFIKTKFLIDLWYYAQRRSLPQYRPEEMST